MMHRYIRNDTLISLDTRDYNACITKQTHTADIMSFSIVFSINVHNEFIFENPEGQ